MFQGSLWFQPSPNQGPRTHQELKAMKRFLFLPVLPFFFLGSGCSHHSIREGIWELAFDTHFTKSQDALKIPTRQVKVKVGWDTVEGEIAEISLLSPDEPKKPASTGNESPGEDEQESPTHRLDVKPMFADILVKHEGDPPSVQIDHQDGYWVWRMSGYVKSPTLIAGTNFHALYKHGEQAALNGRWSMRWLSDQ